MSNQCPVLWWTRGHHVSIFVLFNLLVEFDSWFPPLIETHSAFGPTDATVLFFSKLIDNSSSVSFADFSSHFWSAFGLLPRGLWPFLQFCAFKYSMLVTPKIVSPGYVFCPELQCHIFKLLQKISIRISNMHLKLNISITKLIFPHKVCSLQSFLYHQITIIFFNYSDKSSKSSLTPLYSHTSANHDQLYV